MPDLKDGETFEMQGSGSKPYVLKNTGGVYYCTCPAWRNQSLARRNQGVARPIPEPGKGYYEGPAIHERNVGGAMS